MTTGRTRRVKKPDGNRGNPQDQPDDLESPCWIWPGFAVNMNAVALTHVGSTMIHQYLYEAAKRQRVGSGMTLKFSCGNRNCVNPAHMELIPIVRPVAQRGRNKEKTHCPDGHPYSGDNLYLHPKGYRVCRECHREQLRRYNRKSLAKQRQERATG